MRITEVEFIGLRSELPAPAVFSWGSANQRNVGLVRVACHDGTTGWGETSVTFPLWSLEERSATVTAIAGLFIGAELNDPDDIAIIVQSATRRTDRLRLLWSHVGLSAAIGAIEMALWDAFGRHHDVPVWQILDGKTLPVPLYAVGFPGTPTQVAAAAAEAIDEGYRTVKVRVGFDPEVDENLVRAVAEAVGPGVLIDANMGWTREQAAMMLPRLESFELGWIEEPLSRDDLGGYATLRNLTRTPLAAGENCYSEAELVSLAESGLVDVVMPDLARAGGLTSAIAGARAARAAGYGYSTHHYASDLGFAAMLALCAVVGESEPVLRDLSEWELRESLLAEPLEIAAGIAQPYRGAGLAPLPRMHVIEEHRVL